MNGTLVDSDFIEFHYSNNSITLETGNEDFNNNQRILVQECEGLQLIEQNLYFSVEANLPPYFEDEI